MFHVGAGNSACPMPANGMCSFQSGHYLEMQTELLENTRFQLGQPMQERTLLCLGQVWLVEGVKGRSRAYLTLLS